MGGNRGKGNAINTYIYNVIIKQKPESVTFDDADVMSSVLGWRGRERGGRG